MSRSFPCLQCGYSAPSRTRLKIHTRTHSGEKPYVCTDCEKRFAQKTGLNVHQRTHTGEKPYACDECEQSFAAKAHLQRHKRTHTGEKPFACDECEKRFADTSNLAVHKRTHTGEKPYACDECDQRFTYRNVLAAHKRTHTGERPYACTLCDKCFTQSAALDAHKRTHTGEKPYACPECDLRFAVTSSLEVHKLTHTRCALCGVGNVTFTYRKDSLCSDCGAHKYGKTRRQKRQDQLFDYLREHLPEVKFLFDKQVPDNHASKRRPDVFLLTPTRRIFGEWDEHQHRAYKCIQSDLSNAQADLTVQELRKMYEDGRMNEMAVTGQLIPCVFVRCNPDTWHDEGGIIRKIPLQKRFERFMQEMIYWRDAPPDAQSHFASVVRLYYDGPELQYDFVPVGPEELQE